MCGTDGLQAHESGLGIVMGHDTKSVRCILALESAFLLDSLRPRGPQTETAVHEGKSRLRSVIQIRCLFRVP